MKEVQKIRFDKNTQLEYKLNEDGLYYPIIKIDKNKEQIVGKYGKMHGIFLEENNETVYNHLSLNGELYGYLAELDNIIDPYEQYKLEKNYHTCASEVVMKEVVYGQ